MSSSIASLTAPSSWVICIELGDRTGIAPQGYKRAAGLSALRQPATVALEGDQLGVLAGDPAGGVVVFGEHALQAPQARAVVGGQPPRQRDRGVLGLRGGHD